MYKRQPIFYISTEEYDALTPGATCALGGSEGKHALVKRLELGERIDLGDGTGRRALGTVASINADGVSVQVQELCEERSVPSIYPVSYTHLDVYKRQVPGPHGH